MKQEYKWLPELEGAVPKEANGYALSIYSIAYEAWRRGLNITFENIYQENRRFIPKYSIYNKDNKVIFHHTRPHLVSKKAINICLNKQLTRETLHKANVPVPKGRQLKSLEETQIKKDISDLNFPLVVKPLKGRDGRGVVTGIDNYKELIENIEYLSNKLNFNQIIVEEYIEGEDYSVFVIGEKVIGAFRRLPPTKNNVSSGVDPIDATDELSEKIKNNLIKAVQVIPGLIQGGVDIIYDKKTERYAVLEINTRPSISNHLYPVKGNAHKIPKAIIDHYFPETIGNYLSETTPKYYFDYIFVKDYLLNNRLKNFTLRSHPYEPNLISKTIEFQSRKDLTELKQMIRNNFHKLMFNGEMNQISLNKFELIIAGNNQDIEYFIDQIKSEKYITKVQSKNYHGPVKIGFSFNVLGENNTEEKIRELEEEIIQMKNSRVWKITSPLRKLIKKSKKVNT